MSDAPASDTPALASNVSPPADPVRSTAEHSPARPRRLRPRSPRDAAVVRFEGVQTSFFERSAYDLALATGSLANIDRELAFHLSRTSRRTPC